MSKLVIIVAAIETLQAKIAKALETVESLQVKLAEQENLRDNFAAIEALGVGSSVVVTVGRGETRQELVGVIEAVKPGEVTVEGEGEDATEVVGERLFKVKVSRTGDAFDAEYVTVSESRVGIVPSVEADAAE